MFSRNWPFSSAVAANDDATAELLAELAEIDENLIRNDLTELQQGIQHARRKRIYEALHPETKAGGDRKSEAVKNQTENISVSSYAADAATAIGTTERTVRNKTRIGEQLESVAEQLTGTAIEDNQSELLALASQPMFHRNVHCDNAYGQVVRRHILIVATHVPPQRALRPRFFGRLNFSWVGRNPCPSATRIATFRLTFPNWGKSRNPCPSATRIATAHVYQHSLIWR